jgi:hypothetical protein
MFSSPFWFSSPYESTIEAPRNIYLAADVVVEVAATETALASFIDGVRSLRC